MQHISTANPLPAGVDYISTANPLPASVALCIITANLLPADAAYTGVGRRNESCRHKWLLLGALHGHF